MSLFNVLKVDILLTIEWQFYLFATSWQTGGVIQQFDPSEVPNSLNAIDMPL